MTSVTLLLGALLLHGPSAGAVGPASPDTIITADQGAVRRDTASVAVAPALASNDTVRRRPKAVEVSDAYALRLTIHHYTAFTTIPLFALQSISGNQLYQAGGSTQGHETAAWLHSASAAGLGAAFTINTVTGLWNLWDSRDNPNGRVKRWLHSGLLLASDAGFTYAGIKLGSEARRSQSARDEHRRIAFISMGTALVGYGIMLVGDH